MWKLIWKELFVYTLTFLSISLVYRHGLTEDQQKTMEQLIIWCRQQSTGESLSQGGEGRGRQQHIYSNLEMFVNLQAYIGYQH